MIIPRSPFAVRFCLALFDYTLIAVLAFIGSLCWLAVSLGFNPDMSRMLDHCEGVVVGWTLLAAIVAWRLTSRRSWRVVNVMATLVAGMICVFWLRGPLSEATTSSFGEMETVALVIFQVGVFLLWLVTFFLLRRWALKRGLLPVTSRAVLAVGVAGFLVYLGMDESVSPSIARNQAVLAGANEDEASYLLTLRYSHAPAGTKIFVPPTHTLTFSYTAGKRREYLLAHRAEIEANWAELTEVRAWWAEMAALPELGDAAYKNLDQAIMRFQPVRAYTTHALAMAGLRALDGDGDGAMNLVFDVYQVGAKLEPSAATLVRGMVAVVVQKQALEMAGFILDQARVSPEVRTRFAALLVESKDGRASVQRLLTTESSMWTPQTIVNMGRAREPFSGQNWSVYFMQGLNTLLSPVMLNPQATANQLHDYFDGLAALAANRDEKAMVAYEDAAAAKLLAGFQVKNLAGRMLVKMAVPAFSRVGKSHWQTEDLRTGLIERLKAATEPAPAI